MLPEAIVGPKHVIPAPGSPTLVLCSSLLDALMWQSPRNMMLHKNVVWGKPELVRALRNCEQVLLLVPLN